MVITDCKSELYESMSGYLRDNGYTVKVLNLINMDHSDSWNCLAEVGDSELMAQTFSDIVLTTSSESNDAFWFNAELNLLKALVLYVSLEMPPERRNLGTVYDMIVNENERSLKKLMTSIRNEHVNAFTGEVMPPSPAYAPFSIFMQSSETVRTSVIIGLGSKLQVLQAQQVKNITSHSEIDLELPGKQKCAYFCIVSDQDSTFEFSARCSSPSYSLGSYGMRIATVKAARCRLESSSFWTSSRTALVKSQTSKKSAVLFAHADVRSPYFVRVLAK